MFVIPCCHLSDGCRSDGPTGDDRDLTATRALPVCLTKPTPASNATDRLQS